MELLKDYVRFVDEVTSDPSKSFPDMIHALGILEEQGVNPARLLTAGIGMAGECGEFNEIRSELCDIMWYVAQACLALNTNIEEIIEMNTVKLESRYPGGFDAFRSENRKEGDI